METCAGCGGRGAKIQTIRMGPMIQQVQQICDSCGGNGTIYRQQRDGPTKALPGGYKVGEKVLFTAGNETLPSGDKLVRGQQGEVTGPAALGTNGTRTLRYASSATPAGSNALSPR